MEKELLEILQEIRDTLRIIEKNTERISNPISSIDGKKVNEIFKSRGFKFPNDYSAFNTGGEEC